MLSLMAWILCHNCNQALWHDTHAWEGSVDPPPRTKHGSMTQSADSPCWCWLASFCGGDLLPGHWFEPAQNACQKATSKLANSTLFGKQIRLRDAGKIWRCTTLGIPGGKTCLWLGALGFLGAQIEGCPRRMRVNTLRLMSYFCCGSSLVLCLFVHTHTHFFLCCAGYPGPWLNSWRWCPSIYCPDGCSTCLLCTQQSCHPYWQGELKDGPRLMNWSWRGWGVILTTALNVLCTVGRVKGDIAGDVVCWAKGWSYRHWDVVHCFRASFHSGTVIIVRGGKECVLVRYQCADFACPVLHVPREEDTAWGLVPLLQHVV